MTRLYHWFKKEVIKAIPAVLFFGVAFNLILYTDTLLLKSYEVRFHLSYLGATIGALFAGKIIVIADAFPFVNAFPHKTLIYNITWKCFFYGVFTFLFRILEDFVYLVFKHEKLFIIFKYFELKMASPTFWLIQIWVFVLFAIYIVSDEFIGAIGKKQIQNMLFG